MYVIESFLEHYGLLLLFLLGFAEFLGLPLAGGPILILLGAVAQSTGVVGPWSAIVAVSSGGLASELVWFGVARWQGRRLLGFACGFAANPGICAARLSHRVAMRGVSALFFGKLIPGSGAVPAIVAGLAHLPVHRFLLADTCALLLWASLYFGLGWLLGERVEGAMIWAERHAVLIVTTALAVVIAAVAWRLLKVHIHRTNHGNAEGEVPVAVKQS